MARCKRRLGWLKPQYGSFFLTCCFFGLTFATGQFPALVTTGLPLEGLQFALLILAFLSVIFNGLSARRNFALTALFTYVPYVTVLWYPQGSEQKMTAAMSSCRSFSGHVHAVIINGGKKNNSAAVMPANSDGQTIV